MATNKETKETQSNKVAPTKAEQQKLKIIKRYSKAVQEFNSLSAQIKALEIEKFNKKVEWLRLVHVAETTRRISINSTEIEVANKNAGNAEEVLNSLTVEINELKSKLEKANVERNKLERNYPDLNPSVVIPVSTEIGVNKKLLLAVGLVLTLCLSCSGLTYLLTSKSQKLEVADPLKQQSAQNSLNENADSTNWILVLGAGGALIMMTSLLSRRKD